MTLFTEIRMLALRKIQACLRNPVFLFMGVIMPLLYLAFFTPMLGTLAKKGGLETDNVLTLFVPGMLPIVAFSTGLFTGFSMIDEVRAGVLERFRVTPVSRFAILSGAVLFDLSSVFFQSFLFICISLPFGFRASGLGLVVLFLLLTLLAIITSSFGNAMGLILKSEDRYAPIVHGIHLPVLLLSGTLLPMSLAPRWLNAIAHCNPVFYVVEASRALAVGHIASIEVFRAFLVLIPFAAFTMCWATHIFKKAVT